MMKTVVYPGSFDPITLGHINIINRVKDQVDHLIILVSLSENKTHMFSPEQRCEMIQENFANESKVSVEMHNGLTVNYMQDRKIRTIVRGVRTVSDFEMESSMAYLNKQMNKDIETFVVFSEPQYTAISSRFIKEIAKNGGDLSTMVPQNVEQKLLEKLNQKK